MFCYMIFNQNFCIYRNCDELVICTINVAETINLTPLWIFHKNSKFCKSYHPSFHAISTMSTWETIPEPSYSPLNVTKEPLNSTSRSKPHSVVYLLKPSLLRAQVYTFYHIRIPPVAYLSRHVWFFSEKSSLQYDLFLSPFHRLLSAFFSSSRLIV